MTKNILIAVLAIIVVGGAVYFIVNNKPSDLSNSFNDIDTLAKNSSYVVEGDVFSLQSGSYSEPAGTETKVFSVTSGDINQDGKADAVTLLFQNPGGSGTFFYVSALVSSGDSYKSSDNSVFVGDRISPQTVEIRQGQIILNYADRYPWEPFVASPSVGKSKYLTLENNILKEKEMPKLSLEKARSLIEEMYYKNCTAADCPTSLDIDVLDGVDGVWYVQAIFNGVKDDSVDSQKMIYAVHFVLENWVLGERLINQVRCQKNRGHQEFSEELCI